MKDKKLIIIILSSLILLLTPFMIMQFTDRVNWALSDFVIAGVLLLGTGLLSEFVIRKVRKKNYRIVSFVTFLIVLLLIFVELSVGIFRTLLSDQ